MIQPATNPELRNYYYDPPGSLPGIIHTDVDALPPKIAIIDYNQDQFISQDVHSPHEITPYLESNSVSWIDVQGLGHCATLFELGQVFHLHALTLEDIANVPQRPKVEDYDDHLLLVTHMMQLKYHRITRQNSEVSHKSTMQFSLLTEQVSFVLGPHYVLTVQEDAGQDTFGRVRDRIYNNRGQIRQRQVDYLTYCILDTVIDGYFPVLEQLGEYIEELEDEVLRDPTSQTLSSIHQIKRDLLTLRRAIWPQREMLAMLTRDGSPLISQEVQVYLRDWGN